jgi:hypothetical protein
MRKVFCKKRNISPAWLASEAKVEVEVEVEVETKQLNSPVSPQAR